MTDEICAVVPWCLGHSPLENNNSKLRFLSAYGLTWPLFLASTCVLERINDRTWSEPIMESTKLLQALTRRATPCAAAAQAAWIIGRMEYISKHVGLHWASSLANGMRGEVDAHSDRLGAMESRADNNADRY